MQTTQYLKKIPAMGQKNKQKRLRWEKLYILYILNEILCNAQEG